LFRNAGSKGKRGCLDETVLGANGCYKSGIPKMTVGAMFGCCACVSPLLRSRCHWFNLRAV
jgi:hypothetical protein